MLFPLPGNLFCHLPMALRSQSWPHLFTPAPSSCSPYLLPSPPYFFNHLLLSKASHILFYFPFNLLWPLHKCTLICSLAFYWWPLGFSIFSQRNIPVHTSLANTWWLPSDKKLLVMRWRNHKFGHGSLWINSQYSDQRRPVDMFCVNFHQPCFDLPSC